MLFYWIFMQYFLYIITIYQFFEFSWSFLHSQIQYVMEVTIVKTHLK